MEYEQLKLENQLCFPVYAASRLITRAYQPSLDELEITYPQYLVLLVLWEKNEQAVKAIAKKLILKTNTITPLLKRMEKQDLIIRKRSEEDERKVIIKLSEKGQKLKEKAANVPEHLYSQLLENELDLDDLLKLKEKLDSIITTLSKNE